MTTPPEKVKAEIDAAFVAKEPSKLRVSGQALTNAHTDEFDGAELDVVWNEQRETPDD